MGSANFVSCISRSDSSPEKLRTVQFRSQKAFFQAMRSRGLTQLLEQAFSKWIWPSFLYRVAIYNVEVSMSLVMNHGSILYFC